MDRYVSIEKLKKCSEMIVRSFDSKKRLCKSRIDGFDLL